MKKDFVFYNCQRGTHGNCKPKLLPGLCNRRLRGMIVLYIFAKLKVINLNLLKNE